MKKRLFSIMISGACILLSVLCGCSRDGETKIINNIKDDIDFLTSDICSGRLYGTSGNEEAAKYITSQLMAEELIPLINDEMSVSFTAELPAHINTKCTLQYSGESLSLSEGVDYIPPIWESIDIQGEIVRTYDDGKSSFLIKDNDEVLLRFKESEHRTGWQGFLPNSIPEIILTETGVEKLSSCLGGQIHYQCENKSSVIELNNIIAVLPGKNRQKAIVLGAHFDHMGRYGNIMYQGALDNASGVSVLLQIARSVSNETPDVDVVFAFWNAEEHGFYGSKSGAELIRSLYDEMCYINLDCLAYSDGGNIEVFTENDSIAFQNKLVTLLHQEGYEGIEATNTVMSSDHVSFSFCSSVCIGHGDSIGGIIHTPNDTAKVIDYKELQMISQALASVLTNDSTALFETNNIADMLPQPQGDIIWPCGDYLNMTENEQQEYRKNIAAQLKYDEYVLLPDGNKQTVVKRNVTMDLPEVAHYYPGLTVPEAIGEFTLEGIWISETSSAIEEGLPNFTVLNWYPSKHKIRSIYLYYGKGERMVELSYFCYGANQRIETEVLVGSYDKTEVLDTNGTIKLYHSNEGLGYSYAIDEYDSCLIIKVGEKHYLSDRGIVCLLSDDYINSRDDFLNIINPFLENLPIVDFLE